jgi:beta-phosphoglucomutase
MFMRQEDGSMIRAVIFDMDGVLIDAREWHYEALNEALRLFGHEISRHDHETRFDGLPTATKLRQLSAERCLPAGLHSFINRMKQAYTLQMADRHLMPNIEHVRTLRSLRSQGYRLGVASNSIRRTIEFMMERAGLAGYLDIILSNEDVSRPKPAPEIYRKAMQSLGVAPDQALVVEDNPYGWQAATEAGAHLLRVRDVHDVTCDNIVAAIAALRKTAGGRQAA